MISLRAGSATDVGLVRSNNQDRFLVAHPLFAVADGMGGAAAGEVASAIAVEALNNAFSRSETSAEALVQAAQAANRAVWDKAEANPEMRGMGTTLVALALVDDGRLAITNIGDSRLYRFHDGDLRQVTSDHNLVAEMVAEGRLTKEEAEFHPRRNIMTRALGVDPEVPVDLFVEEAHPEDRFVLCSDGLPREVSDEYISAVLRRLADPQEVADELVEEAKRRGGNDNITVVVVDVVEADPAGGAEATVDAPASAPVGDAAPTDAAPTDAASTGKTPAGATIADADSTTALPVVDGAAAAPPSAATAAATTAAPPTAAAAATTSAAAATSATAAPPRRRLHPRRNTPERPPQPQPRPTKAVNLRVLGFILALIIILAAGAAGVVWYARSAYFVGLRGSRITVFQGRPGGVLWFQPTVARATPYTTSDVLPVHDPTLKAGQEEPSIAAAQTYIQGLLQEYQQAQAYQNPPAAAPAPSTTVAPAPVGGVSTTTATTKAP